MQLGRSQITCYSNTGRVGSGVVSCRMQMQQQLCTRCRLIHQCSQPIWWLAGWQQATLHRACVAWPPCTPSVLPSCCRRAAAAAVHMHHHAHPTRLQSRATRITANPTQCLPVRGGCIHGRLDCPPTCSSEATTSASIVEHAP